MLANAPDGVVECRIRYGRQVMGPGKNQIGLIAEDSTWDKKTCLFLDRTCDSGTSGDGRAHRG